MRTNQLREERFERSGAEDLPADFASRQTYIGSDEVPEVPFAPGLVERLVAHPMSLARDTGRVILVAGAQGSGKTVLSTVIGEVSHEAEPPLTSEEIAAHLYAFFHIEEQDRLPQLLDGLKKNPKQADLDLLQAASGSAARASSGCAWRCPRPCCPTWCRACCPIRIWACRSCR